MTNTSDVTAGHSKVGKEVDHFLWDTKYAEQSLWVHCFKRTRRWKNGLAKSLGKKKRPSLQPLHCNGLEIPLQPFQGNPGHNLWMLLGRTYSPSLSPTASNQKNIDLYPSGGTQLIPTESPWQGWEVAQLPGAPCQREELPGTGTLQEATQWSKPKPSSTLSSSRPHDHSPLILQFFAFYQDHMCELDFNTIYHSRPRNCTVKPIQVSLKSNTSIM